MPDSSRFAVTKNLLQAAIESPDAPEWSRHPLGTADAPTAPLQQTEGKGKDVAEVAAGVTDEASSSKILPSSELVSTSSGNSNFDSSPSQNPTGNEEAAVTVPAHAIASTMIEASEITEEPADLILEEKKQSLTNDNPEVKDFLQNREPTLFGDQLDQLDWTSGMGPFMAINLMKQRELTGEGEEEAADHLQVNEPPMGIGGTVRLPTFEAGFANQGGDRVLMPALEMKHVGNDEFLH